MKIIYGHFIMHFLICSFSFLCIDEESTQSAQETITFHRVDEECVDWIENAVENNKYTVWKNNWFTSNCWSIWLFNHFVHFILFTDAGSFHSKLVRFLIRSSHQTRRFYCFVSSHFIPFLFHFNWMTRRNRWAQTFHRKSRPKYFFSYAVSMIYNK